MEVAVDSMNDKWSEMSPATHFQSMPLALRCVFLSFTSAGIPLYTVLMDWWLPDRCGPQILVCAVWRISRLFGKIGKQVNEEKLLKIVPANLKCWNFL